MTVARVRWFSVLLLFCLFVPGLTGCATSKKNLAKAEALFESRNYQEAEPCYEKIVKRRPQDVEFRYRLAACRFVMGKPVEAALLCEEILKEHPHHLKTMVLKAEILLGAGEVAAGQALLEEVVRVHPEDTKTYLRLADIYRKKEQFDRAAEILLNGEKANVDDPASLYAMLHQVYDQELKDEKQAYFFLRRYAETAAGRVGVSDVEYMLRKQEEENPGFRQYYHDRMNLEAAQRRIGEKKLSEAEALLEKVVIRDAAWHRAMGLLSLWRGSYETALTEMTAACRLAPEDPEINYLLGLVYWRRGDRDKARHFWEMSLRLNPDYEPARQALQRTP